MQRVAAVTLNLNALSAAAAVAFNLHRQQQSQATSYFCPSHRLHGSFWLRLDCERKMQVTPSDCFYTIYRRIYMHIPTPNAKNKSKLKPAIQNRTC